MAAILSLLKSIALLDVFTGDKPEWALADLSRALSMPKPTVHHIVSTLESAGWLEQHAVTKKYRLGIRLWEKGRLALENTQLADVIVPFADRLRTTTSEAVRVSILDTADPQHVVYIYTADSLHSVREVTRIGAREPSHCVATGKVLLAFTPSVTPVLRRASFAAYTSKTLATYEMLAEDLERVRVRGYSINRREYRDDVVGIGAPIRDHRGDVVAAIGISGPAYRLTPMRLNKAIPAVLSAANDVSVRLGYRPSFRQET